MLKKTNMMKQTSSLFTKEELKIANEVVTSGGQFKTVKIYNRQGVVFRAQKYQSIGMDDLWAKNKDHFEIKKHLSFIKYKPLDRITDQVAQELNILPIINNLLETSKTNSNNTMGLYQVNVIFLQGHGGTYKKNSCLIIPNQKGEKGSLRLLNVCNLA